MSKSLTFFRSGLILVVLFAFLAPMQTTQAGFGSLIARKAAKKADDVAGGIGHKLDFDGLKHLDVEAGVHKFGLATHADGSLSLKGVGGAELHIKTPDELESALARLGKAAGKSVDGSSRVRVFVSADDLFASGQSATLLKKIKGLHVVTGARTSLPVRRIKGADGGEVWGVQIAKNIVAAAPDARSFKEVIFRMNHAFNPADMHVVSFSRKAPSHPDVLNYAKSGHVPDPTLINPKNLDDAFATLHGKKLIVSGKIDGDALLVKTGVGPAQSLSLTELRAKARAANIDLIVLGGKKAAQPVKGRTLGRKADPRLAAAFQVDRYGEFLSALGGGQKPMLMHMEASGNNHVVWRATPAGQNASPGGLLEAVGEQSVGEAIAGKILEAAVKGAVHKIDEEYPQVGVELTAKTKEWQEELENRIVPGVPYILQLVYVVNIIAGLIAWGVANWVLGKLWRERQREEFRSAGAYWGRKLPRLFVLIFVIMGLFGIWFFVVQSLISMWEGFKTFLNVLMWPVRKIRGY